MGDHFRPIHVVRDCDQRLIQPGEPICADPTNATHATLIDPMAHGGHAETDLAMLRLFGCDRLDDLIRGYDEASPLADGWRDRVGLHQLAPLLLHCVIYGGYFLGETLRVATRYI